MASVSWKGGSGNWTDATYWISSIPSSADDVSISVGGTYTVTVTAQPITIASLTIGDASATLAVDATTGGGGSFFVVSGLLTNSGHLKLGNATLQQATTMWAANLWNTGEVDLTGSSRIQSSLYIAATAPTELDGKFVLSGDSLLAFHDGLITDIGNNALLSLTGSRARVALASAQSTNSALSQLGGSIGTLNLAAGAKLVTKAAFVNNGVIDVDSKSGTNAGSQLSIGGTLTNRGTLAIGNAMLTAPTLVTVANLVNANEIDLTGSGARQATLNVTAAAPSTFTGINKLTGDALLEYASGAIKNIVVGSQLVLDGAQARVALASATTSNSALTALAGNAGTFDLEDGALVATTGDFTNTGSLRVDYTSGSGGSSLAIGGTLTNSASAYPNGVKIGNSSLSSTTLVSAASYLNTGETDITGAPSVQASLTVAGAAPTNFGGIVKLTNDALLQFGSGAITEISSGSQLVLNGKLARVALAASSTSNSALTQLAANAGTLDLENGALMATTVGLNNTGTLEADYGSGSGGTSLTIGGTLTSNATIKIGNTTLSAQTIVKATGLSNTGEIDLTGAATTEASLLIGGAAPATMTGINKLTNDAQLQYGSGAITAIGTSASLVLSGALARVTLAATPASNSALTTLANIGSTAILDVEKGAAVATTVALSNTGTLEADYGSGSGGSRLSTTGTLTNSATIKIGNASLNAATIVKASKLSNSGEIDLTGARSVQASLLVSHGASATLTGTYKLTNDALLQYASGAVTAIGASATLLLSGSLARVALSAAPTSNSALTTLASNAGTLDLEGGAAVSTTVGFNNTSKTKGLDVDISSAGGSQLAIGGVLTNSGTIAIGNSTQLTKATNVSATALQNQTGSTLTLAGIAAPATLTLAGASTDDGSITVNGGGVLALGGTLTVAGTLTLSGSLENSGTVSGGTLAGAGTIGSGASSSVVLDNLTIASGATFTAGANSTLTLENVVLSGSLKGSGSAELQFENNGTLSIGNVSGFPVITLADGAYNKLTLTSANFTGIADNKITINDGDSGNKVNAAALTADQSIVIYAGSGTDSLTGGAGNDMFFAGGHTTMTGGTGADDFVFSAPGSNTVTDFSTFDHIDLSNFGFSLGLTPKATAQALPSNLIGSLTNGSFSTTTQRFAYDQSTGHLLYDADGSGGAYSAQIIATLTGDPALTAAQLFSGT